MTCTTCRSTDRVNDYLGPNLCFDCRQAEYLRPVSDADIAAEDRRIARAEAR